MLVWPEALVTPVSVPVCAAMFGPLVILNVTMTPACPVFVMSTTVAVRVWGSVMTLVAFRGASEMPEAGRLQGRPAGAQFCFSSLSKTGRWGGLGPHVNQLCSPDEMTRPAPGGPA